MKYLLSILLISSIGLTQELEVEGDLKVTGTVESATIDSLNQVIANLQAQIDAMQVDNQLETRVYELPRFNFDGETYTDVDLTQITGHDLEYAIVDIIHVSDFSTSSENTNVGIRGQRTNHNGDNFWISREVTLRSNGGSVTYPTSTGLRYDSENSFLQLALASSSQHVGYVDFIISVTAQFPD